MVKKSSIIFPFAAPLLGFAVVTGCTSAPNPTTPTQFSSTTPSASPSAVAVPVPVPSSTAKPAELDCRTLVTPAAWTELTSNGFQPSEGFETKARSEGGDLARLLDLGGIVCQWGYPQSDATVVLGFAHVTPKQEALERAHLASHGWIASMKVDGRELWALATAEDTLGNVPGYEFRERYVRFALNAERSFQYFAV